MVQTAVFQTYKIQATINNGLLAFKVRSSTNRFYPVLSGLIFSLDLFGVAMDQTSLNTLSTIETDVSAVQIEPMKISTYLFKS